MNMGYLTRLLVLALCHLWHLTETPTLREHAREVVSASLSSGIPLDILAGLCWTVSGVGTFPNYQSLCSPWGEGETVAVARFLAGQHQGPEGWYTLIRQSHTPGQGSSPSDLRFGQEVRRTSHMFRREFRRLQRIQDQIVPEKL